MPQSEEVQADELYLNLGSGYIGDDLAGCDQSVVDDFRCVGDVPGDIRYLETDLHELRD